MYSKTCPIPVKNVRDKLIETTPLSSLLSDCILRWLIKAVLEFFLSCSLNIISCSHKIGILFPQHIILFPEDRYFVPTTYYFVSTTCYLSIIYQRFMTCTVVKELRSKMFGQHPGYFKAVFLKQTRIIIVSIYKYTVYIMF